MFYLPQLVQALRVDVFGALHAFLLAAARASCMLAHRLVWLCETEAQQDAPGMSRVCFSFDLHFKSSQFK